jgi:hypothetical protein
MKKTRIAILAIAASLVCAAVVLAAQVNVYTVTASTSPTKSGTKKHPKPVKLNFNYTVGEKSGQRPALIDKYSIGFGGMAVNTAVTKGCTADRINQGIAQGIEPEQSCPKGSQVGSGKVENRAGQTTDPTSQPDALKCHLDLKIYNSGKNHAALYLKGNPTNPSGPCPLAVDQAIDATFVKKNGGTALEFSVDQTLQHPAAGIDNAVVQVQSSINKVTGKVKGVKHGFFETVGDCKNNKRPVNVTFHQVDGTSQTVNGSAKCTK